MPKPEPKSTEMQFFLIVRQIRIIGIAIILTISLIFFSGLVVSGSNINKEYSTYNLVTLIICPVLCVCSFFLKNSMLKKVTLANLSKTYFNAIVLPFALCDLGGILCITTSLFINQNIPFAITGYIVTLLYLLMNFPKIEEYSKFSD